MAFNSGNRFPPLRKHEYYRLSDPGSYQNGSLKSKIIPNKAPFLSKAPRITSSCKNVWTEVIYDASLPTNIPNCTSLTSKRPRFPYEALSKEDIEQILCKCGINVCECYSDQDLNGNEQLCHALVPRKLFKGHPPRSSQEGGISMPGKTDQGFVVYPDGSKKRIQKSMSNACPPFYDVRVTESTAFYQGCKWSRWTSKRSQKMPEKSPGPADYSIVREATRTDLCLEAIRSYNKKISRQPRFIEIIQEQNIRYGLPGPSSYSPNLPKGTVMQSLGPKADRFPKQSTSQQIPGPSDYCIKRDFEHHTLPKRQKRYRTKVTKINYFGNTVRFKAQKEIGPSPATYNPRDKCCKILNCSTVPFGTSAVRFKKELIEDDDDEVLIADEPISEKECQKPTWVFKSKTVRFRPLRKQKPEPIIFDTPKSKDRSIRHQYISPFNSSEGRFRPWHDWLPVFASVRTPGPGDYYAEKPKCIPSVTRGPLVRTKRFSTPSLQTPAPNEYNVGQGLETVLYTHNQKLKNNVENQHKFHWKHKLDAKVLTFEQKESVLLNKCIKLLETDTDAKSIQQISKNEKMLRYFLYNHTVPIY